MDKKTKKKVIIGTGIIGACAIGYVILKNTRTPSRVSIYKAFNGFKESLPKGIISTYALDVHPMFPVKNEHIVSY